MDRKVRKKTPAGKKQRNKLSVCMIVKNEEKMLPRCLESVKDIADEIVIVDTGSTDNTIEIARKYGAKIYQHPWQNNFSLHRNQSISYATGDWILQIDADEELDKNSNSILREILQNAPKAVNGFTVMIQDVRSNGNFGLIFNYPRLFRNRIGVKYVSRVHNQVIIPPKIEFSAIRIFHYGYDLDRKTMLRKFKRSTTLLKRWAKEEPDNPEPFFYLANGYSQYGRSKKCIEYALKTIELLRKQASAPPFFLSIYYALATALMDLENLEAAEKALKEAIEIYPDYLDGYYLLSSINYVKKNFNQAIQYGKTYLKLRDEYHRHPQKIGNLNIYTLNRQVKFSFWYGISLMATGHYQKGLDIIYKALDQMKDEVPMALEACHNAIVVANLQTGKKLYERFYFKHGQNDENSLLLARDLANIDFLVWLNDWTEKLTPKVPSNLPLFKQFLLYTLKHDAKKAWDVFHELTFEEDHVIKDILQIIKKNQGFSNDKGVETFKFQASLDIFVTIKEFINHERDIYQQDYISPYDLLDTNIDHSTKEWIIVQALIDVDFAIQEENIEKVLINFQAISYSLNLSFPKEFDDVNQILNMLLNVETACSQKNMPDAGLVAMALANKYFSNMLSAQVAILRHNIARSNRLGKYPEWFRIILKYLYPSSGLAYKIKNLLESKDRITMEKPITKSFQN